MSTAEAFGIFEERPQGANTPAIVLALAVHVILIGMLFVGVRWQSHRPSAMVVELWRAPPPPPVAVEAPKPAPKVAPPPAPKPEPKPEPKLEKPDIAVKEAPKPKPKPVVKPRPVVEKPKPRPREDKEFTKRMRAELAQEQQTVSTQRQDAELRALLARESAAAKTRAQAAWIDKISAKIRGNIILPPGIQGNPELEIELVQLPTGEVLSVKVRRSSGNRALDAAVERGVLKASPLPKPDQPDAFERQLRFVYRPFERK